jgi:hypothetical protein
MATMTFTKTVQTQVEATLDSVVAHLREYAATDDAKDRAARFAAECDKAKFPAKAGELVYLTQQGAATFGAIPDMPVLVIAAPEGPPIAIIAFVTEGGPIKTARITSTLVARVFELAAS